MKTSYAIVCALVLILLTGGVGSAATEAPGADGLVGSRLAFVFGNTEYARLPRLPNARNDAEDISEKLRGLGFQVVTAYNLTRARFVEILSENEEAVLNAEAVMFYYAGHGVQIDGKNYLVPSDANIASAADIDAQSILLDTVIGELQDRDRPTLIFLDACRNSPLGEGADGRVYQDGLAQLEAGDSTFIAFSTQPGNVTLDGTGRNSPFTTAFLEHVTRPGLSISDLMIEVRKSVETLSYGRQTPWDQSSLRQQFYFTENVQVDPGFLASKFASILENPDLRDELRTRLASADPNALHQFILQNAVTDTSELSRNTAPGSGEAATGTGAPRTDVAALRTDVSSSLTELLYTDPASGGAAAETKVLARRVQTELARLGCYRMTIDGIWGPGSRRSLADFYAATSQDPIDLNPTMDVLSSLFLQTGRLCKPPRRIARRTEADEDAGSSSGRSGKSASKRRSNTSAKKKPAVLPPDISAGIGIGGIF